MGKSRALWEHRLLTRLTTIKLAVGILDRRAPLSDSDRNILRFALEASDQLADEILSTERAEENQPSGRTPASLRPRQLDSASGRPVHAERRGGPAAGAGS